MSELPENNPFGFLEFKPDSGLKLNIVTLDEVDKDSTFVLVSKQDKGIDFVKGAYRLIKKEGEKLELIPIEELGDLKIRQALAKALVEMHKQEIMKQSVIIAEQALTRKPIKKLKSFFRQKKEGHKLELKTRAGCVSFCIGNEETIL